MFYFEATVTSTVTHDFFPIFRLLDFFFKTEVATLRSLRSLVLDGNPCVSSLSPAQLRQSWLRGVRVETGNDDKSWRIMMHSKDSKVMIWIIVTSTDLTPTGGFYRKAFPNIFFIDISRLVTYSQFHQWSSDDTWRMHIPSCHKKLLCRPLKAKVGCKRLLFCSDCRFSLYIWAMSWLSLR